LNKVLITGACGYLGARLCKHLAKAGYRVTAFDSYDPSVHTQWVSLMDEIVVGDIRDESTVFDLADRNFDVVVHLISLDHFKSEENPSFVSSINVLPTWNLLDKLTQNGLEPVVHYLSEEKEIKEFLHDEYFGNNRYSYIPYGRDGGLNQVPVDEYWIHDALSEGYLCLVKSFDEESNEFEEEASIDEAYEMYDNTQIEFGKNQAAQVWEAYLAKKGEKKVPFFNRYYAQYEREKDTFVKTEII